MRALMMADSSFSRGNRGRVGELAAQVLAVALLICSHSSCSRTELTSSFSSNRLSRGAARPAPARLDPPGPRVDRRAPVFLLLLLLQQRCMSVVVSCRRRRSLSSACSVATPAAAGSAGQAGWPATILVRDGQIEAPLQFQFAEIVALLEAESVPAPASGSGPTGSAPWGRVSSSWASTAGDPKLVAGSSRRSSAGIGSAAAACADHPPSGDTSCPVLSSWLRLSITPASLQADLAVAARRLMAWRRASSS